MSGLHRGVTVPLERRRYCVGSALMADIALRDAGVASEHVEIDVGRRRIHLEAIGADVGLRTGRLPMGHGCYLRLPIDLVLGQAVVRVLPPGGEPVEATPRSVSRRMRIATRVGVVAVVGLCLIGGTLTLSTSTQRPEPSVATPVGPAVLGAGSVPDASKDWAGEPPRIDEAALLSPRLSYRWPAEGSPRLGNRSRSTSSIARPAPRRSTAP